MPLTTGRATDFITFSRSSGATVVASDGKIDWAGHNLVLNSGAPATQTLTVEVGRVYTVECTGSGSVTLSGAGTGTVTNGSPVTVTASTTSLVLTVSGSVTTMWAYRSGLGGMQLNPATGTTYYPTTGSIYNAPRLDYDPSTLAARGLLVEEQRTNLLLRSAEFDNAVWAKTGNVSITANFDTAPDGTLAADKFVSIGGSFPQISQAVTFTAGQSYTFSVWVKSDGTSQIAQALLLEGNTTAFTPTSTWTRISVTVASSAGGSRSAVIATNSGSAAASSFLIWGAQLEAGSFATSYIPTLAASATRSADVASVATSAFPYLATEGTLVANFAPLNVAAARRAVQIDDGTENERVTIGSNSTPNGLFTVIDGGASQAAIATGTPAANTAIKIAVRWNLNDFAASANGAAVATDTSGTLATGATTLRLGMGVSAAEPLNGWLRQVTYLPVAKTNAELQTRST